MRASWLGQIGGSRVVTFGDIARILSPKTVSLVEDGCAPGTLEIGEGNSTDLAKLLDAGVIVEEIIITPSAVPSVLWGPHPYAEFFFWT